MKRLVPFLILVAATADASPRGKIVRIERGSRARSPHFCIHESSSGTDKDTCIGNGEPRIGDEVTFVDDKERIAKVKISSYSKIDGCTGGWRMNYATPAPDVNNARTVVGWYGIDVGEHGKMVNNPRNNGRVPNGYADEFMYFGLDRDGDDKIDNAVSFYACDANAVFSQNSSEWCVSLWDVSKDEVFTRLESLANLKGCSR